MVNRKFSKATNAVWAGEDNPYFGGAVTTPIVNSVAFAYKDLDEWYDVSTGKADGFIYSRNTNPTVASLEEKIRVLEGAENNGNNKKKEINNNNTVQSETARPLSSFFFGVHS